MSRPRAYIRFNPYTFLIKSLQNELDYIKKNKQIKVVIIQSTGPSFSAGHDLTEVRKSSKSEIKLLNLFKACSKMMLSIRYLPQPVIACIDGIAAAAGCQLVASCDLSFASKNSYFQTPGVNIGLFCSTPMVAISRKISSKDMMYMLLSGEKISAFEAEKIKLINKIIYGSLISCKKRDCTPRAQNNWFFFLIDILFLDLLSIF